MSAQTKSMAMVWLVAASCLIGSVPSARSQTPDAAVASTPAPAMLQELEARAITGDAEAQFELGMLYYEGNANVPRDDSKAATWFSRAAQGGSVRGQAGMGLIYQRGRGVPKDVAQAAAWYERAAAGGHRYAKYRLALLLDDGIPVPADDPARAVALLRASAEAGDPDAQNDLGLRYELGKGVTQDLSLAGAWYVQAAGNGSAMARANMGYLAERGLGQPQDHVMAAHYYESAAAAGNAWARYRLGRLMVYGYGIKAAVRRGMDLLEQAAAEGQAGARYELGLIKEEGRLVPKDLAAARWHYLLGAEAGHALSQFKLGYLLSTYEPRDLASSVEWTRKAAEQNIPEAQNNLGLAYEHGDGIELNWASAVYWYAKAAQQGSQVATNNLARLTPKRTYRQVAVADANVREAPNRAAKILATLPKATVVYPIDTPTADWLEVYVQEGHLLGFMAASTLAQPKPEAPASRVAQASSPWPARPAARPGVQTCNTRCDNGDCYRVYGDGRKVRFQAPRKFNALSNQFEWDSGGC